MRLTTTRWRAAGALVVVVLAAGCTAGTPTATEQSPSPSATRYGVEPDRGGEPIEPLDAIEGAERQTVDGVGFDVPAGVRVEPTDNTDVTQLRLTEPGAERPTNTIVIATVADADPFTESDVDVTAFQHEAELEQSGGWTDATRTQVEWEGTVYAVALRARSVEEAGEPRREAVLVTGLLPDGRQVVTVSAEAPEGELEESVAYQVLRTVRFEP